MAILSGYPGLEVTVEIDGQRAKEYDAPADEVEARVAETDFYSIPQVPVQGSEPPYTIKYIESKPGKRFAFGLDSTNFTIPTPYIHPNKHVVQHRCFLDGTSTNWNVLPGGKKTTKSSYTTGSEELGWKRNRFQFSTIEIAEEGDRDHIDQVKQCGTLVVKLWHSIDLNFKVPMGPRDHPVSISAVSEKVLKGRSVDSRVHFNSKPKTYSQDVIQYARVDPEMRPFAVFEFRYRTMEGLMSEGIVPRPASEDDQVAEPEKEHEKPLTPVKPDPESTPTRGIKPEPDSKRGIKRELMDSAPLQVCYKLRRLENGKVEIDLTDD
ncbi:hypothetical protein B0T20DRAFT_355182 [Sordaria brevicollis]|uniref:DUF7918 domain-containing protein n=1 Tax=Sordaria brevicollis TaxID=83679 RepID=A0AAE0PDC8_SORBR|nr:hypothetical protein B0T20DRAFT_355182 [Sordaria brevicollis]